LKKKVDINRKENGGQTPLLRFLQASFSSPEIYEKIIGTLIDLGADVNLGFCQCCNGAPFTMLANRGWIWEDESSLHVAKRLLEAKADTNVRNQQNQGVVEILEQHGGVPVHVLEWFRNAVGGGTGSGGPGGGGSSSSNSSSSSSNSSTSSSSSGGSSSSSSS